MTSGWQVALCTDVTAVHMGAGTGGDPAVREAHFHASHERYVRKYFGPAGWQGYRAAVPRARPSGLWCSQAPEPGPPLTASTSTGRARAGWRPGADV